MRGLDVQPQGAADSSLQPHPELTGCVKPATWCGWSAGDPYGDVQHPPEARAGAPARGTLELPRVSLGCLGRCELWLDLN